MISSLLDSSVDGRHVNLDQIMLSSFSNSSWKTIHCVFEQCYNALCSAVECGANQDIDEKKPVKAMSYNSDNEIKGTFGALLRDDYYPGDVEFNPLGLKPSDAKEFSGIQTK